MHFISARVTLLFVAFALTACSEQSKPPGAMPSAELPAAAESSRQHTEFVVLIDNSRSIKPPEQVIIREATMLLADLADPGDRIAVITFGERARTVVETRLASDRDRETFKGSVRSKVDFGENYSDIRAGIRVLAEERGQLLPFPEAVQAAVLFTDGKLEPKDKQTRAAFEQIREDLRGRLVGVPIYAVVLGDSYSRQAIPGLTELTGVELMRQHIASSPKRFYHARDLEELPDIAVTILNDTKGISSLGEETGSAFRVDSTVELMNLIVRKRPPGAADTSELPLSSEIELLPPELADTAGTASVPSPNESIYRNRDYQHFDLFVVRHPRPGIWRVKRTDGKEPRVLSKIVSPVKLRVHTKAQIYVNEATRLQAWLYDEGGDKLVHEGYELQARVADEGTLASSENYAPLVLDEASGHFALDLPESLFSALGRLPEPGRIEVEVIARKEADSWFLRRSQPIALAFREPLVVWREVDPVLRPIPFLANEVAFGATVDKESYQSLGFQGPASLKLYLDRFDPQAEGYRRIGEHRVDGSDTGDSLTYLMAANLDQYGDYSYGYAFSGPLAKGQLRIQSPAGQFRVEFPWLLAVGAAVVVLVLLQLLSAMTARLRGSLQIEKTGVVSGFETVRVTPRRELRSTAAREVDLGASRFRIRARRQFFLIKRLCVSVTGTDAFLDGKPLKKGKRACVKARGQHTLRFTHEDGDSVEAKFGLRF